MPNGNTDFHIQINFSELSLYLSIINSFCEFNPVAIRNKGNPLIFIRSTFQNYQSEIPFSIYKFAFHNSVSNSVSYFGPFNFSLRFLSHDNGSIRKLNDKCKVSFCFSYMIAEFLISKVNGYTQLPLTIVRSLLNECVLPNMHTKNYAKWVGFVCTALLEAKSNRL